MTESKKWSLKPVYDILENISDYKELVNHITSECQTEIIKKISFYNSNNTYTVNSAIHYVLSNISNI
jgi:hypothetical protein